MIMAEMFTDQYLPSGHGMYMVAVVDTFDHSFGRMRNKNFMQVRKWCRKYASSLYAYTQHPDISTEPVTYKMKCTSYFAFHDESDVLTLILANDSEMINRTHMWKTSTKFTVMVPEER